MPALRFDMTYPQREGFTRQLIKGIDIWAYTLPLAPGETEYRPPMARRADNSHINATRLLQLSALNPSQRARELNVRPHIVIRGGLNNIQGTWVPLERAIELAKKYKIDQLVAPILFDPDKPPTEFIDERHKGTTADSLPVGAVYKNGIQVGTAPAAPSGSSAAGAPRHSAPSRAVSSFVGSAAAGPGPAPPTSGSPASGSAAAAAKLGRTSMGSVLAGSGTSAGPSGSTSAGAAGSSSAAALGKRKFGADDASGAAALFGEREGRNVEIASWTSRSHGGDASTPTSTWTSGRGGAAGASGSTPAKNGAGSSAEGNNSVTVNIAKGSGSSADDIKNGDLDAARNRSPALSDLRGMLQSNKRRALSPGLRSAAVTNAARSSVRAGLERDAGSLGGGASGSGPLSLAGSSNIDGAHAGGSSAPFFPGGLDPSLAAFASPGMSMHDPATWDSKFVAAFGRTRGWHEQRVLSRLRDSDIDGQLLLTLDFNDQSVFMLNQCGITVTGDQIRIIQAATQLRESYAGGAGGRSFSPLGP